MDTRLKRSIRRKIAQEASSDWKVIFYSPHLRLVFSIGMFLLFWAILLFIQPFCDMYWGNNCMFTVVLRDARSIAEYFSMLFGFTKGP